MRSFWIRLCLGLSAELLVAVAVPPPLQAQTQSDAEASWMDSVDLTVGAAALYSPDYEGSNDYEFSAIPIVDLNVADVVFLRRTQLGVNAITLNGPARGYALRMGPVLNYRFGRDEDDNDALTGLGDVDGTIEGGAFIAYRAGPFSADLTVLQDLGDGHEGLTASLEGAYRFQPSDRSFATLSVGTVWADDAFMKSYFGIDATQAAASGYSRYDAEAGFKEVKSSVMLGYRLTDSWTATSVLSVSHLLGDAADSPIVDQEGSAIQGSVVLGLSYKF